MSRPGSDDARRRGWAIAALAFGLAAPLAYMAQRLFDHASTGPTDPLSMLRQARVVFVWRAATSAFWGGLAGLVAFSLNGARQAELPVRSIITTAALIATAFLIFAWVLP